MYINLDDFDLDLQKHTHAAPLAESYYRNQSTGACATFGITCMAGISCSECPASAPGFTCK